jgi:N-acetylglucosaminyl-diphospho-decaprenol L-rhamnosyltransferase
MRSADTAVIVPTWRRHDLATKLLETLSTMESAGDVILVENESKSRNGLIELRHHPMSYRVLACSPNLGFAGAVNHALRNCHDDGYKYFFILNDDLEPALGFFQPIRELLSDPGVAFAGPITLDRHGEVESCGVDVDPASPYVVHHRTLIGQKERINVASVHGAAMAFTAETLERVGYLDEDFFYAWEETDWCMRAKSLGLTNCITTRATACHMGNASLRDDSSYHPIIEYMLMRNMLFFLQKRSFGVECIEDHIEFWLHNCDESSFQEHTPPPDPVLARAVIARAVLDYRRGRAGIWPPSLSAQLTRPQCSGELFS